MATTLKLKKTPPSTSDRPAAKKADRPPVRGAGSGVRARPTLAEAQAQRAEREALWQQERQQERQGREAGKPHKPGRPAGPRGGGAAQEGRGGSRGGRPGQPPADRTVPRRGDVPGPSQGPRGPQAQGPHAGQRGRPNDERGTAPRGERRAPASPAFDTRHAGEPQRGTNTAFGRSGPKSAPSAAPAARNDRPAPERRSPAPIRGQDWAHEAAPQRRPGQRAAAPAGPAPRDRERHAQRSREAAHREPPAQAARASAAEPPDHAPGSMRLSKRMSELGLASRRDADEWIEKGWVRVDGEVVRELGSRVLPGQAVTIDAPARQQQARQVTVLLNKPIGFVSGQAEDGYEPAFVLVAPENQWREDASGVRFHRDHLRSLVPAGRLDIDSTGLLVLTQDGRVAKTLIGENSPVDKEYLVRVQSLEGELPAQQALSARRLAELNHGLELDGEPLRPAKVEWVNEDQLRFVLVEGKKRQIRRMCEAVGLKVTGLKRVRIGRVMLGDLPVGQWRYLRADEGF